ncbi:putative O-glycosylation ligase, exosortase A system-associated [Colwellia sp. BRX10-6]|jgi:probable O-glycosylation ligase (exosortase A-associated)|uniref:putative O-glycosylation ligase, exosortase A system-associated n=1 Tax=unclassified Colwellia TaxID=196834 RepID=UPI0015F6BC19|nr:MULTISPECIES: putative O-glycosylation ligase, exosortase A system-associated [unclassified Colwellia]MBA6381803.1 putative O-glycosylation ligase, exosortase A system-associated [Colwellia sp. BRX10-9]MBA6393516.1 putative O-glycosylation ligase, exosortase A system-associated [Colwellia sp. BRX10-6]
MKDTIFILLFLPFVFLTLRNPFIGLCAWIWTIMAVPKNMLWGFATDIRYTLLLAIITIISMLINKDSLKKPPFTSLFYLLILFLIHITISNTLRMGSSDLTWQVWADFFKAIIFSMLVMTLLTTKNRIETFLIALLIGVGFNIFFEGLKYVVSAGNYTIVGIENSMMTDNNLFALAILMVLPLYFYMASQVRYKYVKLGFLGLAGLSVVCVIGSFSRGGFVGLIIVGWQIFLKVKRKLLFLIIAFSFISLALTINSDQWTSRMQTIEHAEEDKSFLGRTTAWKLATLLAIDNPVFGGGQNAVQHLAVWQLYYIDIHKFDFITSENTTSQKGKAAHSIYFQVLGDAGFVGLFIFLLILYKSFRLSARLAKNGTHSWLRELAKAIKTILLVYMTSGALLSFAYYDLIYVLIGILVCIERINIEAIADSKITNN